ncbi:putative DNA-binding pseudobarrel domain superfamily [Helianthus anomalus]
MDQNGFGLLNLTKIRIYRSYVKKLKEVKFEISVLSNEGLEVRKDASGRDYVHGCLIQAKEETYYKQVKNFYLVFIYCQLYDLSHDLLWLLSERRLKIDNLVAKVHGPKQSCKVDVYYVFPPENEKGLAAGFMGSGWTTFCFENDIEERCQLLFQWKRSTPVDHFNFTVKIFNKDRIGLHMGTTRHCSCSNHRHRKGRLIRNSLNTMS